MLNKKHNLKSGNSKDKRKGFETKNKKETKKRERISGKKCNWIFWCCSFHETKAKKKGKERKRQKPRNKKRAKKKDKKEKRNKRTRERQRKRNGTRGKSKRLREKERETQKINKKCLFLGGKQGCFLLKAKKGQQKKKTKRKTKKQYIRRVQGQVRWPFGPPHLTLKPSKKNKTKKQKQKNNKKQITNKEGLGPSEVALRATSPDP